MENKELQNVGTNPAEKLLPAVRKATTLTAMVAVIDKVKDFDTAQPVIAQLGNDTRRAWVFTALTVRKAFTGYESKKLAGEKMTAMGEKLGYAKSYMNKLRQCGDMLITDAINGTTPLDEIPYSMDKYFNAHRTEKAKTYLVADSVHLVSTGEFAGKTYYIYTALKHGKTPKGELKKTQFMFYSFSAIAENAEIQQRPTKTKSGKESVINMTKSIDGVDIDVSVNIMGGF